MKNIDKGFFDLQKKLEDKKQAKKQAKEDEMKAKRKRESLE